MLWKTSKEHDEKVYSMKYASSLAVLCCVVVTSRILNTLRLSQNGRYFANDIFKRIFFNENVWISIKISLKFIPKGPINKIPALFQIMAWRCPGDKPLSEAMLVSLLMHRCVTRPQWVNGFTWDIYHYPELLSYPGYFQEPTLTFNGAPRNIQGNLTPLHILWVVLLALGQSNNFPDSSEATQNDMSKINYQLIMPKQRECKLCA